MSEMKKLNQLINYEVAQEEHKRCYFEIVGTHAEYIEAEKQMKAIGAELDKAPSGSQQEALAKAKFIEAKQLADEAFAEYLEAQKRKLKAEAKLAKVIYELEGK